MIGLLLLAAAAVTTDTEAVYVCGDVGCEAQVEVPRGYVPGYKANGPRPTFVDDCGTDFTRDECVANQRANNLICQSLERVNISDWDPALVMFQGPAGSIADGKVKLAAARAEVCPE